MGYLYSMADFDELGLLLKRSAQGISLREKISQAREKAESARSKKEENLISLIEVRRKFTKALEQLLSESDHFQPITSQVTQFTFTWKGVDGQAINMSCKMNEDGRNGDLFNAAQFWRFQPVANGNGKKSPYLVLLIQQVKEEDSNSPDFKAFLTLAFQANSFGGAASKAARNKLNEIRNSLIFKVKEVLPKLNGQLQVRPQDDTDLFFDGRIKQDFDFSSVATVSYSLESMPSRERFRNELTELLNSCIQNKIFDIELEEASEEGNVVNDQFSSADGDLKKDVVRLIQSGYRNIMLSGPPGTGKSYLVYEIAKQVLSEIRAELDPGLEWNDEPTMVNVQFHPAYSYEDFVEGWRPTIGESQVPQPNEDGRPTGRSSTSEPKFELSNGRLLEAIFEKQQIEQQQEWWREKLRDNSLSWSATKSGRADLLKPVFVVLDEINRANIPRVFGEILQLIEVSKRSEMPIPTTGYSPGDCKESIRLATSGRLIAIPENFVFIATMNTSDRSISRLDDAFRRRFTFVPVLPSAESLRRRWAEVYQSDVIPETALSPEDIARGFEAMSSGLPGVPRDKAVGHTYFMPNKEEETAGFTKDFLTTRLVYQVIPYLQTVLEPESDLLEPDRIQSYWFGN